MDVRLAVARFFRIGDGGKRRVVDRDQPGGVLRDGAAGRDDERHRLTAPARRVDGERVLQRRIERREQPVHAAPRLADFRDVGAREHRDDTRQAFRGLRVDRLDACMGVRRTQHRGMQHTGDLQVADIAAAAMRQPPRASVRHALADRRGEGAVIVVFPRHSGARRRREPGIQRQTPNLRLDSGSGADAPSRNDQDREIHASSLVLRHRFDRVDDRLVAGAAAVVAGQRLADFFARRVRIVR